MKKKKKEKRKKKKIDFIETNKIHSQPNMATPLNTFDFITDSSDREMYETAFTAITQLELWPYLKSFNEESFMFSDSKQVNEIYKKIEQLGYGGHSGASFGCTMRTMQFIANRGVDGFKEKYLSQNNRTVPARRQSFITPPQYTETITEVSPTSCCGFSRIDPIVPDEDIINTTAMETAAMDENSVIDELEQKGYQQLDHVLQQPHQNMDDLGKSLISIIQNGANEFQEKTGRPMTYLEMRAAYG